jgi:signal transduction histidine kinase
VDNAIKYNRQGGAVEISASQQDGDVIITVRDTGVCIPADEIPRIWERLYRGDKSRSEKGLGLGLSLVKAFTQAHGGSVDVSSELQKGSVFTIRLPSAGGPQKNAALARGAAAVST